MIQEHPIVRKKKTTAAKRDKQNSKALSRYEKIFMREGDSLPILAHWQEKEPQRYQEFITHCLMLMEDEAIFLTDIEIVDTVLKQMLYHGHIEYILAVDPADYTREDLVAIEVMRKQSADAMKTIRKGKSEQQEKAIIDEIKDAMKRRKRVEIKVPRKTSADELLEAMENAGKDE